MLRYYLQCTQCAETASRTTVFMAGVMEGYAPGRQYDAHEFLLHSLRQFECDSRYVACFLLHSIVRYGEVQVTLLRRTLASSP